jgi:hypothetical protein
MPASATFQRSAESQAFEDFWRSLRSEGFVPKRADFHPSRAVRFLRSIVLLDVPSGPGGAIRIRVSSQTCNQLGGRNLSGENPLDYLPEQFHAGAVESARLMVAHPCGLWQISPVHLLRGYATYLEITIFPLAPGEGAAPSLLGHVRHTGGLIPASLSADRGFAFDTATQFEFLNIGAGVPHWTSQAA